jgi:hypothetical protein
VAVALVVLLIINIPMILRVRRVMVPLKMNDDATSLTGRFRWLKMTRLTGKVVSSGQTSVTKSIPTPVQGTFSAGGQSGTFVGMGQRIKTDVYTGIRIEDRQGHLHDVNLKNNSINANRDDLITVAQAHRGNNTFDLAAINHSLHNEPAYYNEVEVHEIQCPRQVLFVFELIWSMLTGISVVGVGVIGLIGPALCGAYVYFQRRQRSRFVTDGIQPLRSVAADEIRLIKAPDSRWGMPAATR